MKTLYKYTNKDMCGWEFVLVTDKGEDGRYVSGNTASTAINYRGDITIEVKNKKQLKDLCERLDWLGKFTNEGRK